MCSRADSTYLIDFLNLLLRQVRRQWRRIGRHGGRSLYGSHVGVRVADGLGLPKVTWDSTRLGVGRIEHASERLFVQK